MYGGNSFSELEGVMLSAVEVAENDDEIRFHCKDGRVFRMYHEQNCCEDVSIEEIHGELQDLIGNPILFAEERNGGGYEGYGIGLVSEDDADDQGASWRDVAPSGWSPGEYTESFTWTFYRIGTIKGTVTIRWYGSSNGYYSEGVDFILEEPRT